MAFCVRVVFPFTFIAWKRVLIRIKYIWAFGIDNQKLENVKYKRVIVTRSFHWMNCVTERRVSKFKAFTSRLLAHKKYFNTINRSESRRKLPQQLYKGNNFSKIRNCINGTWRKFNAIKPGTLAFVRWVIDGGQRENPFQWCKHSLFDT